MTTVVDTDVFLAALLKTQQYDYVVGNPPYVAIEGLSDEEKQRYRSTFQSASGRMDLYFLFFEQALRLLKPGGWVYVALPDDIGLAPGALGDAAEAADLAEAAEPEIATEHNETLVRAIFRRVEEDTPV